MKRFVSLLLAGILLCMASLPASAASIEDYYTYVPDIPSFATGADCRELLMSFLQNDTVLNAREGLKTFITSFYDDPYLVLLNQQKYDPDKEEKKIDYDKDFWIIYIKPKKADTIKRLGYFNYTGGNNLGGFYIAPMRYINSSPGYQYFFVSYNHTTKKFVASSFSESSTAQPFTYVIDSSIPSNTAKPYPYFNELSGKYRFEVSSDFPDRDRHYNWWLNVKGPIIPPNINEDTDGDGKPDINIDQNGDGVPDINIDTDGDKNPDLNVDTNQDGKPDINIDDDGDGNPDRNIDTNGDGKPDLNIDTNGNGKPNINVDTNGDGKPDINIDKDKDGKPDINIDTNGDGKPDKNVDTNGDGKPDFNVDTNGDGKPDFNVDTNGDGKPDFNVDTNGDGKPDLNVDTDKDGKPDLNVDTNGDGKPDINIDTNGDGFPDINIDTDGDGKPDLNVDTNGDGKPDTNIRPDGSGGGSSGGGSDTGDNPADWFPPDDDSDLNYDGFPIFNPFDYDNYTPPSYNDPFNDYNPLDGLKPGKMPDLSDFYFPDPNTYPDPFANWPK